MIHPTDPPAVGISIVATVAVRPTGTDEFNFFLSIDSLLSQPAAAAAAAAAPLPPPLPPPPPAAAALSFLLSFFFVVLVFASNILIHFHPPVFIIIIIHFYLFIFSFCCCSSFSSSAWTFLTLAIFTGFWHFTHGVLPASVSTRIVAARSISIERLLLRLDAIKRPSHQSDSTLSRLDPFTAPNSFEISPNHSQVRRIGLINSDDKVSIKQRRRSR